MVFWSVIFVTIVVVVGAVAIAAYCYKSSAIPPLTYRNNNKQRRRQCENEDSLKEPRTPKSKPGDRCICCISIMSSLEEMHQLKCGHAVHEECFQDFLKVRCNCLICGKKVIGEPDDACTICLEPMADEDRTFLNCEHALHGKCLAMYRKNGFFTCPLCRKLL